MATYAIGDIQGCFQSFQGLLKKVQFDPEMDRLWLLGDLVNRGPDSYEVLRWVYENQEKVKVVLGNHDLYFISRALISVKAKRLDTLTAFLERADVHKYVDWLRQQPLFSEEGSWVMMHAGVHPLWTLEQTRALAEKIHLKLKSREVGDFLKLFDGFQDPQWSDNISFETRDVVAAKIMTRIRACHENGLMNHKFSGAYHEIPEKNFAWFEHPLKKKFSQRILFGHWSSLGLTVREDVVCLDTGCVRGRFLTAMRIEDGKIFQQPSLEKQKSKMLKSC